MTDKWNDLKEKAEEALYLDDNPMEGSRCGRMYEFQQVATPENILKLLAELKELKLEIGLLEINKRHLEHNFKQADQCAHEREIQILALSRELQMFIGGGMKDA